MPRPSTPPGPRLAAFDTPPLSPQSHTTTLATLQDGADVEKSPSTDEKDVGDLQEVPGEGKADEEHESVPTAPPPFPDGGRRAYLNTCGGVLVLLSTFGASNGWAVFQAHLAAVSR